MQHLFAPPLGGQERPPALMVRRLRRRQQALAGRPTDRLFFAILPDAETAGQIAETARHLRTSHGLAGKPLRPEHFHVTLCPIEDGIGLTPGLVERVKACAASVAMPPFRVSFDRAESFRNGALVL